jgi:alanyl-tRNA synthetase
MEIWNNVFMQFNRDEQGVMTPLPKPSVDTGMGLERISTVMQGVTSNYDTDLIQGIIRHVEKLSGKKYRTDEKDDVSMRVIADHSRAITFLICDGVLPSNEGRGYVLRRIMRRAARHAKMLGFSEPVLYRIVDAVISVMAEAYPDLLQREEYIKKVVKAEEERFAETLDNGLRILNDEVAALKNSGAKVLPGEVVFKLYDTYGFPMDLTADIVSNEGFTVDEAGFENCMEKQREQAREHWKGSGEERVSTVYKNLHGQGLRTAFTGYDERTAYSVITALLQDGNPVESAAAGTEVDVITETTPFYGESGGQAGDTGEISTGNAHLEVVATLKPLTDLIVHRARVREGIVKVGDAVDLKVAGSRRTATARNHTATHLLQAALRQVLGDHVKQAGSQVDNERLRFDFTHFSAMTQEELERVEELVNTYIMDNTDVAAREMALDKAMESGATALFDEKYGDTVRVVRVGEVSCELCGGTHVRASGDIGLFKLLSEAGIAAGVRRIEALTGMEALHYARRLEEDQKKIASLVKAEGGDAVDRIQRIMARQKELQREIETLQGRLNASASADLLAGVREIGGIKTLAVKVEMDDPKGLREFADSLKDRIDSGVIAIGTEKDGKATLLVAVTKDLTGRFKAGDLIKQLAPIIGGSGGGKPELAQAGGSMPDKLDEALEKLYELVG